jgi:glycosyltransferase involved in cell wall biosynthesis
VKRNDIAKDPESVPSVVLGHRAPLKICYLVDTYDFLPPFVGGVGRIANELSHSFDAKGHEVQVITRQRKPEVVQFRRIGKILIKSLSPAGHLRGRGWKAVLPTMGFHLRVFYFLVRYRNRYDVVLVTGFRLLAIPAIIAASIARRPCIIRLESITELSEDISAQSLQKMSIPAMPVVTKIWRRFRNMVLRLADQFVAVSSEIEDGLSGMGFDSGKIRNIPNATNTKKFVPATSDEKRILRRQLGLPESCVLFTYSGRLVVSKGVLLLIRVWKELLKRRRAIHLVILGSGAEFPDRCDNELRDYIDSNHMGEHVTMTGAVDNVPEYLRASDVFVLPSEFEGFSVALIEALACGLPAIATQVGGAAEMIQHEENGFLILPKSYAALQHAIEWMLDHREKWPVVSHNARLTTVKKYSIDAVADSYIEMFLGLRRR